MDRLGAAVNESLVLTFRIRDAAKRRPEAHADTILRSVWGILQSTVFKRELDRRYRELCVAVQSLQPVRWKNFLGTPIQDLACAGRFEYRGIKRRDRTDS